MARVVAVVDYGMGNLRSVSQAVQHAAEGSGFHVLVTSCPEKVWSAERVILPGQGAMPNCMRELRDSGLLEPVQEAARHKPLMGVCVGMQMMLDRSEEGPSEGLSWFAGQVLRFQLGNQLQADGSRCKVPQMGWNRVEQVRPLPMWHGIPDGSYFYFVHSFFAHLSDACHSVGETVYGQRFTCALARDNIVATQFHPEKSAQHGLALYRNFLDWTP